MFESYVATRRVNIGGKINISVDTDEIVQYDDQSLKYLKDGIEINYPEFRGAIRAGWFLKVPGEGAPTKGVQAPAEQPRKVLAGMSGRVVESDEKYVGKVSKPVEREDTAVKRGPFNKTVQQSSDWEVVNSYKNRGAKVQEIEEQGGVVVGRVTTPTNITITPQNMSSVRQALEAQGPAKVINEHKAFGVGDITQAALDHISGQPPARQVRVASPATPKAPVLQTVEFGELTRESLEPKSVSRVVVREEEPGVVSTLRKDAPIEWDKSVHWRVRAKELKVMGAKDRDKMERILNIEVPSVVKLVRESFPVSV